MITAAPNLNADQLRAVEHPGGPLLVLAGPGTGKTGVLVARIAHLVADRDVRPERILALTFSRRAADEMSERVRSRVPDAALVETRTFHSFALSVVRRHHASLGLSMPPEIMATGEQWALVSELLAEENADEWGLSPGALARPATVREVYDLLLRCQEHLLEPERMRALGEKTRRPYLVRAAALLERYRSRLGELSEVDYEGVVQYALRLMDKDGPVRERLVSSYDHVLVDEFQDTNRSQLELVRRLVPNDKPNVFCVGDDAQSIYGFRGARVENVREFDDHFPGAKTVQLRTNYRSASGIIRLAEDAISGDESRPRREEQWASSMHPGTVLYEVSPSPREEGAWISDRIVELNRARGVPFEQIAILRRSLLDARPLIDALASRGIPMDVAAAPEGSTARHLALLLTAAGEAGEEPSPIPAVRGLYREKLEDGLSPRTVRYIHVTLHKALKQAVADGLIPRNATEAVKPPQVRKEEIRPLTAQQVKILFEAVRGDRLESLYILAVHTGLRQGELLGLKWGDVDLEAGTLQVRRTLTTAKGGPVLRAPKTKASRRTVKLSQTALETLRSHLECQLEEIDQAGDLWRENGLIFASESGEPLDRRYITTHCFKPLLKCAELPQIRFHDLRHTCATLLLSKNVNPKVVSEMLGHATIAITLDTYSHVLPNMQSEAAKAMEDALT